MSMKTKEQTIFYNPEWSPERSSDRFRWVENVSRGLRIAGKASDIIRIRHTGWYVDNGQDETVSGYVLQLPARGGNPCYVPAVSDPYNDDAFVVDFHSMTDDKEDCAHWADSMAEHYAEREREYQAQQDREARLEDIAAEIKELYANFRDTARRLRASCDQLQGVEVVRELVREKWERTKEQIRQLRKERDRVEEYGIEY